MTAVGCGTVEVNPPQHSIKRREKCGLKPRIVPIQLSNSQTVIARSEATKQSISPRKERMDCFVASAPRNDVVARKFASLSLAGPARELLNRTTLAS
jgi:hypothetical protein